MIQTIQLRERCKKKEVRNCQIRSWPSVSSTEAPPAPGRRKPGSLQSNILNICFHSSDTWIEDMRCQELVQFSLHHRTLNQIEFGGCGCCDSTVFGASKGAEKGIGDEIETAGKGFFYVLLHSDMYKSIHLWEKDRETNDSRRSHIFSDQIQDPVYNGFLAQKHREKLRCALKNGTTTKE